MYGTISPSSTGAKTRGPRNSGRGMSTAAQSNCGLRARALARERSGRWLRRSANSARWRSCLASVSARNPGFCSGESRALTTLTTREASSTWTTPGGYSGAILTAVCAALVVAPPIRSGTVKPCALHLLGHMDHLVERRGDQAREADGVDLLLPGGGEDLVAGDHHAQVDDLVVVAGEDDADDVLADVVDVALDRRDQEAAVGLGRAAAGDEPALLLLHERGEVGDGASSSRGRT